MEMRRRPKIPEKISYFENCLNNYTKSKCIQIKFCWLTHATFENLDLINIFEQVQFILQSL